jgi:beta-phosphoglucomutase family hydrolase
LAKVSAEHLSDQNVHPRPAGREPSEMTIPDSTLKSGHEVAMPQFTKSGRYQAVLLDMDGVITDTASIHARCWKSMFDEFLKKWATRRSEPFRPFAIDVDYRTYVDGKPRYEGVRDFLKSRAIVLPDGTRDDPPTDETICGLGNRKNQLVADALASAPVEVYPGTLNFVHALRQIGLKTAVVTSSQNARAILEAANVQNLFDACVDGEVIAEQDLAGKPAPDSFLKAAEMLGVPPSRAVVIEDAISGIRAGVEGGFGLVVGIARSGNTEELKAQGAHIVVSDLSELISSN